MLLEESLIEASDKIFLEEDVVNELSNPLWNIELVQAYKARQKFGIGGEGVTVAIIDSGIDDRHPELERKVVEVFNIEKNSKVDLKDRLGHGTYIAGIIAGNRVGIAPGVKLISIKLRYDKENYRRDLEKALDYCRQLKPDIINISSGSPGYSDILKDRCNELVHSGVIIVASAGNYTKSTGIRANFPASYDSVISVVALTPNKEPWEFNNIWPTTDISAPGVEILSTHPVDENGAARYIKANGTSAAAPHISGILALGISLLKKKQKYIPNPQLLGDILKEATADLSKQESYGKAVVKLLERYQRNYDPRSIFLRNSPEVMIAIYGQGYPNAYEFLKKLDEKT